MRRITSNLLFLGAGLAAGMLMSPGTGKANRAKIRDKASHYSNEVEDLFFEDVPRLTRYYGGRLQGVRHDLMNAVSSSRRRYTGDDAKITNKVKSLIGRPQERIDDSGLNINTEHGVVHLRGYAKSLREKQRIERIAKQMPETINVINELNIAA